MNDLTSTPVLPPPSSVLESASPLTPTSISSSIENYSPQSPKIAYKQTIDSTTSDSVTLSISNNSIASVPDSVHSHNSIKTFSSAEENGIDDDDINDDSKLFESFNGSIEDFASPIKIKPNNEQTLVSPSPKNSLNVEKLRPSPQLQQQDRNDDDAQCPPAMPKFLKSRNITPVLGVDANELKIKEKLLTCESQYSKISNNLVKLDKEIAYLKNLILNTDYKNTRETEKLNYALGKLIERKQASIKENYQLSIHINKLRKMLYGNGTENGDLTQYFARKVSN